MAIKVKITEREREMLRNLPRTRVQKLVAILNRRLIMHPRLNVVDRTLKDKPLSKN